MLAEFLVGEDWPFHHHRRLSAATVADWLAGGAYALPQALAFCIEHDGRLFSLIHLDEIEDIDDGEPLLNIRLTAAARGQGLGVALAGRITIPEIRPAVALGPDLVADRVRVEAD